MNLTAHFTLAELTFSETATRRGIDNTPTDEAYDNLHATAMGLERIRTVLGGLPIRVSSGYRGPKLNTAIGGSKNSKHMVGLAADFTCPEYGTPKQICEAIIRSKETIGFDQLILEFGQWVHVSFPPYLVNPQMEVLTAINSNGGTTYLKGLA